MSNEALFVGVALFGVVGALAFYKLGRFWLTSYIAVLLISANLTAPKVFDFFGFHITAGTALFAALMFSTDMLAERYGRRVAQRAVMIGFTMQAFFLIFAYGVTLFQPAAFAAEVGASMDEVLTGSLRTIGASLIAYLIWANYDVWAYDFIHKKTGEKWLWLRNNLSTMTSQVGGSFTFFFLAFYGVAPDWAGMAMVVVGFYLIFAAVDTVFIYLSKVITPLDVHRDTALTDGIAPAS